MLWSVVLTAIGLVAGTAIFVVGMAAVAQPNAQPPDSRPILDAEGIELQPFTPRPSSEAFYPPQAQTLGIQGRVILLCDIGSDLSLSCVAESETPRTWGSETPPYGCSIGCM